MPKILQLDPHVADLIAAGEVVERPASVIKELMENSIDAGAAAVTVEIRDGGMTYMRVTDNGGGITPEDTETAFLRHATSKLRDADGLTAIKTLGFRGEALAAISAVSRIELLTRVPGANEGTSLSLEGGAVRNKTIAGCPEGTTMIVRDLFYNTPARQKFMKSDRAEAAGISALVISVALSHPEVSVRYIRDGKVEFHTPGDNRAESCIYSLFGRDFAAGLLKAGTDDGDVTVRGFVSTPDAAKGNRSYQYFFVNGRYVKSKTMQAALEQAYKNSLFTGRFPSCVLYVTLRPSEVDVNVHPTKTEVKFLKERQVFDGVYYAALSALSGNVQTAEIRLSPGTVRAMGTDLGPAGGRTKTETDAPGAADVPTRSWTPDSSEKMPGAVYQKSAFTGRMPAFPEKADFYPVQDALRVPYKPDIPCSEPENPCPPKETEGPAPDGRPAFRYVGEAYGTYIIVEYKESLWLIDKHAAHERIQFDRLKKEKQVTMSQTLLEPVVCQLGREDTAALLDTAGLFERLGFAVEPFGESSVAVRQIPSDIELGDAEATIAELVAVLRRGGNPEESARYDDMLHTIACKAAIKAGKRSEPGELERLIARVLSGEIRYCPHGRPVAMELTKAALDRNFKRT